MRLIAALLISLTLAVPAAAHDPTAFGDWFAVCEHDGYCSAWTQSPRDAGDEGTGLLDVFSIGRHGQGTYWEVSFTLGAQIGTPESLTIDVGDLLADLVAPDELGTFGNPYTYFLLGPTAQAVMDRLASAPALSISFVDPELGSHAREFSLTGLTDALIWIDEAQGRLGSERVAEAAPLGLDRVFIGQKFGEIAFEDLPADLAALHAARPDACDPVDMLDSDPAAYDLGEDGTLFFVPCTEGAYNYWFAAYLGTKGGYDLQHFATFQYDGGVASEDGVWEPSFDPATKMLETYNLGRSTGDCGIRSAYLWEGRRFVLVRATAKPDCDAAGEPGEFPLIYERTSAN